jgi:hypothetical protein
VDRTAFRSEEGDIRFESQPNFLHDLSLAWSEPDAEPIAGWEYIPED